MSARVVLAPAAAEQLEAAQAWWVEHRPSAPGLLLDELQATLAAIAALPRIGRPVRHSRRRNLRRVLLPRAGYHIFYQHDVATDVIRIAAIWGAVRGRPPPLR